MTFSVSASYGQPGAQPATRPSAQSVASETFFEQLEVNVVNVEVYVTDKSGATVKGLTAADFEVLEDGRPQKISYFYAMENRRSTRLPGRLGVIVPGGTAPGAVSAPTDDATPPEEGATAAPAEGDLAPPPEQQALRLVVYFDNLFLRPQNRNKVIRQVDRFVNRVMVGSGDLVMLATFDKALHIRHPFTRDLDSFQEKLHEIETVSAFGQRETTQRREIIQRVERSESALDAESHIDFYAKSRHFDVGQSIKGLREVISSLAGLPGRKVLLYVSDGIPMTAGEDLFHLLELKYPNNPFGGQLLAARYSSRSLFRELTSSANANGVTLYTLEATGLRSNASLSAEYGGLGDRSYIEVDTVRDFSLEEPLMMMAADTGGLASLNTNNIDGALERLSTDLDNYYSLGYAPTHAVQGRYHDIKVRMKRKGLKVRHRTGYRDKVASTRVHEGTLATLLYGPEKNPLEIKLAFADAKEDDEGQRLVPLEVRIPLSRVTLVPFEEVHQGRMRAAVAVIDRDGRMSPVDQQEFAVAIPNADLEAARENYYVYAIELKMRPGDHQIAVGIHDDISGETSFIRQSVRTGS